MAGMRSKYGWYYEHKKHTTAKKSETCMQAEAEQYSYAILKNWMILSRSILANFIHTKRRECDDNQLTVLVNELDRIRTGKTSIPLFLYIFCKMNGRTVI